jgi:hypothetical protein
LLKKGIIPCGKIYPKRNFTQSDAN